MKNYRCPRCNVMLEITKHGHPAKAMYYCEKHGWWTKDFLIQVPRNPLIDWVEYK